MPQRKRYTKPVKEEAIRLVNQEGVSLTQVARDLGIITPRCSGDGARMLKGSVPKLSEATAMPMMKNSSN